MKDRANPKRRDRDHPHVTSASRRSDREAIPRVELEDTPLFCNAAPEVLGQMQGAIERVYEGLGGYHASRTSARPASELANRRSLGPADLARGGIAGDAHGVPRRTQMQDAFGTDFGSVRAHTGPEAQEACQALGARAYAIGSDVAFADENPHPGVVAHELTHVVQQRGGAPTVQAIGSASVSTGDAEAEADVVAHEVLTTGRVTMPIQAAPRGLAMLADVGTYTFRMPTSSNARTIQVRARTVEEWRAFLQEEADSTEGHIEINAFLAAATGQQGVLSLGRGATQVLAATPTQEQAIDLMVAFLSTGDGIDLPDYKGEGLGAFATEGLDQARFRTAFLMASFNAQYAPLALQRMTEQGELDYDQTEAIAAYAAEAQSISRRAGGRQASDESGSSPVNILIASALGQATGSAVKILDGDPTAWDLFLNSAMTIGASFAGIRRERERRVNQLVSAFDAGVASLGPLSGGLSVARQVAISALGSLASAALPALFDGDERRGRAQVEEQFGRHLRQYAEEKGLDRDRVEDIRGRFRGLVNTSS